MVTVTAAGIGIAIGSFSAAATWATIASVAIPLIVSTGIYIATAMLAPTSADVSGPRLSDLKTALSDNEGKPIPKVYGTARIAGTVIWSYSIEEDRKKTTESGQTTKTYKYYLSFAVGICEGPIVGVRKIWADNKIIYDEDATGEKQEDWLQFTVYKGTIDQDPDPLMEEYSEGELIPGYRGLAYVVFDSFALADFGNRAPQIIEFEIVSYLENYYYDTPPPNGGEQTTTTLSATSTLISPDIMNSALYDQMSQVATINNVGFFVISYENTADVSIFSNEPLGVLFDTDTGKPFKYIKNSSDEAFDFRSDYANYADEQPFIAASQNNGTGSDFCVGVVARYNDTVSKYKVVALFYNPTNGERTNKVYIQKDAGISYMPRFRLNNNYIVGELFDLNTLSRGTSLKVIDINKGGNTFSVTNLETQSGHTLNKQACAFSYNPVRDSSTLVYVLGDTTILNIDVKVSRDNSNFIYVGPATIPLYAHSILANCMPAWADISKAAVRSLRFYNNEWWMLFNIYEQGSSKVFTAICKFDIDFNCNTMWIDNVNNPNGDFLNTVNNFIIANNLIYLYNTGTSEQQYNWLDINTGEFHPYALTGGVTSISSATANTTDNSIVIINGNDLGVKVYKYITGVIDTIGSSSSYVQRATTTNVIKDICKRASIPESLLSFDYSTQIKGYTLASRMPALSAINPLLTAYYIMPVESAWKLKFKSQANSTTILLNNVNNFRARTSIQDNNIPLYEVILTEEASLPQSVDLSYIGDSYSFQKRVQTVSKEAGILDHKSSLDYPLIMTDQQAGNLAESLLYRAWMHKDIIKLYLPRRYSYLEPGDSLTFYMLRVENANIDMVITNIEYQNTGIVFIEGHTDAKCTNIYSGGEVCLPPGYISDFSGSEAFDSPEYIPLKGTTYFDVLNLPSITALDQSSIYTPGYYITIRGNADSWSGADIYETSTGESLELLSTNQDTTFIYIISGFLKEAIPFTYDKGSDIKVVIDSNQPRLNSITDDEWVNGYNTIAIKTDGVTEIANFKDAELITENTYTLTNFIRGRYGTEDNIRESNDSTIIYFLYYNPSAANEYIKINKPVSDVGDYSFKAVTAGKDPNTTNSLDFTYTGATHLCYAPKFVSIKLETDNTYTVTFRRRDRYRNKPLWLPPYSDFSDAPHKVFYSYSRGYMYETSVEAVGGGGLYSINFPAKDGGIVVTAVQKSTTFSDYAGKYSTISTTQIDDIVSTASGSVTVTPPILIYQFTDDIFTSSVILDSIGSNNGVVSYPVDKNEYKERSTIFPIDRRIFTFTKELYIESGSSLSTNNCSFWFNLAYNNKYVGTDPITIMQLPGDISFKLVPSTNTSTWALNLVTTNTDIPIIINIHIGRSYHIAFTDTDTPTVYINNDIEEKNLSGVTTTSSIITIGDSTMQDGVYYIIQDLIVYDTLGSDIIDVLYKTGLQKWNPIIYSDQKQENT